MAINTKNLANAIVASDVGTTATTMPLQAGYGTSMPAVPFFLTCTPPGQLSTFGNSEVILVTGRSSDSLTIERAKKSTTAKDIKAGWVVSNSIYVETSAQIGDIMSTLNATPRAGRLFMAGGTFNKADYPLMWQYVVDNPAYGTTNSTTFTLIDMRGRMQIGKAASGTFANLAATGGAESIMLTQTNLPNVQGHIGIHGGEGGSQFIDVGGAFNVRRDVRGSYRGVNGITGASQSVYGALNFDLNGATQVAVNKMSPYIVVNYEVIAE